MKQTFLLAIILALLIVPCVAQVDKSKIILTGKILKYDKNELKLEFNLENKSDKSIYVTTNPNQQNAQLGYYHLLNETDNSVMQISSRVYPHCITGSCPYTDDTRVKLTKLKSGESFSDNVHIKFPVKETIPPNGDPYKNKKIIPQKVKQIEISIGYFFEEQGILDFLKVKPFGWYINGNAKVFSGANKDKLFLEIQNLASINIPFVKMK